MKLKGMVAAFIDVPQEHTEDYNRWYDFDHLPEYVALPGFLSGRRYVTTPECQALRPAPRMDELTDGRGTYFTTYLLGTDDLAKVMERFQGRSALLRKERRIFSHGAVADVGFYRLEQILARNGIPVRPEAMPYLGHRGVYVVLTQVADAGRRAEVDRWYTEVYAPEVLDIPGVVVAMRFSRFETPDRGRYMQLYLLDGDPAATVTELGKQRERWRAQGLIPSPGDAAQVLFQSPYRSVVSTEYDFKVA